METKLYKEFEKQMMDHYRKWLEWEMGAYSRYKKKFKEKDGINKELIGHNCKFRVERGVSSFCDNHRTRYWTLIDTNVRMNIENEITHFSNDLRISKKYHCAVVFHGCIGIKYYDTDNFKDAVRWMDNTLRNVRK